MTHQGDSMAVVLGRHLPSSPGTHLPTDGGGEGREGNILTLIMQPNQPDGFGLPEHLTIASGGSEGEIGMVGKGVGL